MDRILCYIVDVVSEMNVVLSSYAFSGGSPRKLYIIYFFRVWRHAGAVALHIRAALRPPAAFCLVAWCHAALPGCSALAGAASVRVCQRRRYLASEQQAEAHTLHPVQPSC
jgi:hypothetical protein